MTPWSLFVLGSRRVGLLVERGEAAEKVVGGSLYQVSKVPNNFSEE